MIAVLGILVGEEVEFGTPLFNDKVVGPAIYQVSLWCRHCLYYCKPFAVLITSSHNNYFPQCMLLLTVPRGWPNHRFWLCCFDCWFDCLPWIQRLFQIRQQSHWRLRYVVIYFLFIYFSLINEPLFYHQCVGFDPLGLSKNLDADALAAVQTKELNNGRLAMIAAAGNI